MWGKKPKPGIRTYLEFSADSLWDEEEDDDGERHGLRAAQAIIELLAKQGIAATQPEEWESYGWDFHVQFQERKYQVLVQGAFIVTIYDTQMMKERTDLKETIFAQFLSLLHDTLAGDDRFSDLAWCHDDRKGGYDPAPHPLADFG